MRQGGKEAISLRTPKDSIKMSPNNLESMSSGFSGIISLFCFSAGRTVFMDTKGVAEMITLGCVGFVFTGLVRRHF